MEKTNLIKSDNAPKLGGYLKNYQVDEMIAIQKALHDKRKKYVTIDGVKTPIDTYSKTGCRQVQYKSVLLVEQNKNVENELSKLAKKGNKISWGINKGTWFVFYNNKLYANRKELIDKVLNVKE